MPLNFKHNIAYDCIDIYCYPLYIRKLTINRYVIDHRSFKYYSHYDMNFLKLMSLEQQLITKCKAMTHDSHFTYKIDTKKTNNL